MPVLPAVASTTRPPGLRSPRFSASRIIHLPARSFTDWPGFMNSALPRMVQPVNSDARFSLIRGVLPIASTTSLLKVMVLKFFARVIDLVATLVEAAGPYKGRGPSQDLPQCGKSRARAMELLRIRPG